MSIKSKSSTIINAESVAGALASGAIDISHNYGVAIVASFTGAPSGSVVVQGSIDGSTWVEISTDAISGTTAIGKNLDALYWAFIRVSKAAGGTGTMTVKINIKGA